MAPSNDKKRELGQFMTTNYEYILQNMCIPADTKTVIEPFCGKGDLLKFNGVSGKEVERYDIDPQSDDIVKRDTLADPPSYSGKFVLTNPPYLARNKCKDKRLFDQYDCNDLYKCFILSIIRDQPDGGILIIPLNFLSSIRTADVDLRKKFLEQFAIVHVNVFEERVFDDTTYTICAIQFAVRPQDARSKIPVFIYPSGAEISVELNSSNKYMIGGEAYDLPVNPKYEITRLTKLNRESVHTNILVKCIDDSSTKQICLEIVEPSRVYVDQTDKLSSRTYATLVITPPIAMDKQQELVKQFGKYLRKQRAKYHSLFLTNYRESKDIARKRISFGLVYSICGYLLSQIDEIETITSGVEAIL